MDRESREVGRPSKVRSEGWIDRKVKRWSEKCQSGELISSCANLFRVAHFFQSMRTEWLS